MVSLKPTRQYLSNQTRGAFLRVGLLVLGGLALLALYGALDQVMALQPLRSGELL